MEIKVVYLGGSRTDTGCKDEIVRLATGSTVADLARSITARHPALAPHLATVRWARNFEFALLNEVLGDGDEVALLPPVCGGAPRARLVREAFDPNGLSAELHTNEIGATVLFVGTVRRHSHGRL